MNNAAIIDPRSPDDVKKNLSDMGFEIIPLPLTHLVAEPICGHPDIQIFVHKNCAFTHPAIPLDVVNSIEKYCRVTICSIKLNNKYPMDIPYNIACMGNSAIHKTASTPPEIKKYFTDNNINLLNTQQGYSKCSTLIVNDKSIITSDNSIHRTAESNGIDSLLVTPGFIDLPGYNQGFIGGASGRFNKTILLSGRIDNHPDSDIIMDFIAGKGMHIRFLSKNRALDIGSILII